MWLSRLASFILHVFQVYPHCSVCQHFLPLYGLVMFLTIHYNRPLHSFTGGHLVCFRFLTTMNTVSRAEWSCASFRVDMCSHFSGNCRPYSNSNIGRNRFPKQLRLFEKKPSGAPRGPHLRAASTGPQTPSSRRPSRWDAQAQTAPGATAGNALRASGLAPPPQRSPPGENRR